MITCGRLFRHRSRHRRRAHHGRRAPRSNSLSFWWMWIWMWMWMRTSLRWWYWTRDHRGRRSYHAERRRRAPSPRAAGRTGRANAEVSSRGNFVPNSSSWSTGSPRCRSSRWDRPDRQSCAGGVAASGPAMGGRPRSGDASVHRHSVSAPARRAGCPSFGCNLAQGYFLARPLDADTLHELLLARTSVPKISAGTIWPLIQT